MPRTVEKLVYTFEELSDKAKEKARDWFREQIETRDYAEFIYEDADTIAAFMGVAMDRKSIPLYGGGTRYDPAIYFSGFSSQGDGACFNGDYTFKADAVEAVTAHCGGNDAELIRIATELTEAQATVQNKLEARIKSRGNYSHSGTMEFDFSYQDDETDETDWTGVDTLAAEESVKKALRAFADWIYDRLEKEYEYQSSDAVIDENIIANEYEFEENGSLA